MGRDPWVSIGGTAWVVMGLVLATDVEAQGPRRRNRGRWSTRRNCRLVRRRDRDHVVKKDIEAIAGRVNFTNPIPRLLKRFCAKCHPGDEPGDGEGSRMTDFLAGRVEAMEPSLLDRRRELPPLDELEQTTLWAWIDSGAEWFVPIPQAGSGHPRAAQETKSATDRRFGHRRVAASLENWLKYGYAQGVVSGSDVHVSRRNR